MQHQQRLVRTFALALTASFIAACGGADSEPAPAPGDGEQISITPRSGTTGSSVTLSAGGFQPGATVQIGFGPPNSEYEVIATTRADSDGTVHTTVEVPGWADQQREYVFVAVGPGDEKLVSSRFHVTANDDGVRVTGRLTDEGVECPALRAATGQLYTLAGDTGGFDEGDRVTVEGEIAATSFCMQGTTITVESIERAR